MNSFKRVKILYVISSLANEGPTRVLLNLVRHLDQHYFAPSVATLVAEKDHSLLPEFKNLNIPIIQISDTEELKSPNVLQKIFRLRDLIRDGGFEIAHAHCPRSLFLLVGTRTRSAKSFYTLHIYPDNQYKIIHGAFKGRVITAASNFALRSIDGVVACSESVAYEYLINKRVVFPAVNNGIDPVDIPEFLTREAGLRLIGLSPERRYLLYVGRLSPEKRIVELVRTLDSINEPQVDLVVVGAGSEESTLRNIGCPRVHLMGFHADIRPMLAGCDFYISPSSTEGLANTLLEAMSVGLPSLLSDIPSHRFVIDGSNGFIGQTFDPLSKDSLIDGLASLQQHSYDHARSVVRENFAAKFHAQIMSRGYEALYREALE